jgi:hypothetical protein
MVRLAYFRWAVSRTDREIIATKQLIILVIEDTLITTKVAEQLLINEAIFLLLDG